MTPYPLTHAAHRAEIARLLANYEDQAIPAPRAPLRPSEWTWLDEVCLRARRETVGRRVEAEESPP